MSGTPFKMKGHSLPGPNQASTAKQKKDPQVGKPVREITWERGTPHAQSNIHAQTHVMKMEEDKPGSSKGVIYGGTLPEVKIKGQRTGKKLTKGLKSGKSYGLKRTSKKLKPKKKNIVESFVDFAKSKKK